MATPYNGYKSFNAWLVSLHISNDEGLYNAALEAKRCKHLTAAARHFMDITGLEGRVTIDGDRMDFNMRSVKTALQDV